MSGYIELFGKPGNINGILACRIANNLYVPPFGRQLLITAAFFKASNPCAFRVEKPLSFRLWTVQMTLHISFSSREAGGDVAE